MIHSRPNGTTNAMGGVALLIALVAIVATSCGASSGSPVEIVGAANVTAPIEAPSTEPETVGAVPQPNATDSVDRTDSIDDSEPNPDLTPVPAQLAARNILEATIAEDPIVGGWLLPAGDWYSTLFTEPIAFTTDREMVLRDHASGLIRLTDPLNDALQISILEPTSAIATDGPVPWSDTWLEDLMAGSEAHTVADSGDGDVAWVRFTVDEVPVEQSSCFDNCVDLLATRDAWIVVAPTEVSVELAVPAIAGNPIAVVATAVSGSDQGLATALAGSLAQHEPEEGEGPLAIQPLTSVVRDRPIPAGSYVTHLGSFIAELDTATDLEARLANVSQDSASMLWGNFEGSLAIVNPAGLISADYPQLPGFPSLDDRVDVAPTTAEEMTEWVTSVTAVVDQGTTIVGGSDAVWWDVTVDDTVAHHECQPGQGPPDATKCTNVIVNDNGVWPVFDTLVTRLVFVDDADALLLAEHWGGSAAEVWEERLAPIVETLSLHAVDP